ncbi:MAG: HD domain protein [Candidatus Fermentimicrarchaeum limneticum]|uniref:HD domain protein n=1 Tax=Fermentimicrarchaeum limneticum TaxID=2795018 RepID=A0A7D6BH59_FERL1|nr:MAG: HD domain protein [Candidatus Fermentimicrarchaeum limneticum]
MGWEETFERIASELMKDPTHDFEHAKRVCSISIRLAREENADEEVLRAAALLHDVGHSLDEKDHEKKSLEIATSLLEMTDFPKNKMEKVLECIREHRFSKGEQAMSLEAQILQDADRLDAIGAVGIARCFLWSGEHRKVLKEALRHFDEKLLKLKDMMNTKSGREMAEERHRFMLGFLEQLESERGITPQTSSTEPFYH